MDMDFEACRRAFLTRDPRFDGRIFGAVKTTGIYCRPVCPARTPKAETTLYDTPSKLFTPAVVTRENLKAEIIDKKIQTAAELCTGRYADGCKQLGIQ